MEKYTEKKQKSGIVCLFHVREGGRFLNSGYTIFEGFKRIDKCSAWFTKIIIEDEQSIAAHRKVNPKYDRKIGVYDCYGTKLMDADGLEQAISEGVGRLRFNGDYDTTYARFFEDLVDGELEILIEDYGFENVRSHLERYDRLYLFHEMIQRLKDKGRWNLLP